MKLDRDGITMDDGTTYYAYAGIIGVDMNLCLSYGYDGDLPDDMPVQHRKELAAYMIELWTRVLNGEPQNAPGGKT